MLKIELNDASQYEQVAYSKACEFVAGLLSYYGTITDIDSFLKGFCSHYGAVKMDKM